MKLGTYTFQWAPDKWSIPDQKRDVAHVQTYTSVAFFSWGAIVVGRQISLEWDWMPANQYLSLKDLEIADEQVEWDAEADDKLFYSNGVNTPFVAGKTITGDESGETATISSADTINSCLVLSSASGDFTPGETITDDSVPAKTATVDSYETIPIYNVEILSLDGEYFETVGPNARYRRNGKLLLLIMSEA